MRWCWTVFFGLCVGCSFETLGSGGMALMPGTEDDDETDGTSTGEGNGDGTTSTSGKQTSSGVAPTTESETQGDGTTDASETLTPTSTDPSSGGEPQTTGDVLDCSEPRTLMLGASTAQLEAPMGITPYMGFEVASSAASQAGAITFEFDIECPAIYRVFGYVRDDRPETNTGCDPDSFGYQAPLGNVGTWFYGCGTDIEGMTWVQMANGDDIMQCPDVIPLELDLSVGEHSLTLVNREQGCRNGAMAGIAALVVTNDAAYVPGS